MRADTVAPLQRPRLRGVLHHYAFYASLVAGGLLLLLAPTSRALLAAGVYSASLSALLGVSALFHRVTWSTPARRRRMGVLDHSMINVLIAGTFTPFCLLVLSGTFAAVMLVVTWGGALAGILLHVVWTDLPKALSAAVYVVLGWMGLAAASQLAAHLGWAVLMLLAVGGVLYSLGALVYALRRPDPLPMVFGYHEVFHALVVVAAILHYAAVALTIVPRG
jgi:hemolysin III